MADVAQIRISAAGVPRNVKDTTARAAIAAITRTVKTTMDATATVNTDYFLGTQTAVSFALPTATAAGQLITVVFYSGSTAATLAISGTKLGTVPTPGTNQRIELNILWDGTYWAILSNVMETS